MQGRAPPRDTSHAAPPLPGGRARGFVTQARLRGEGGARGPLGGVERRRCRHFVGFLLQGLEAAGSGWASSLGRRTFCFYRGKISGGVCGAGRLSILFRSRSQGSSKDRVGVSATGIPSGHGSARWLLNLGMRRCHGRVKALGRGDRSSAAECSLRAQQVASRLRRLPLLPPRPRERPLESRLSGWCPTPGASVDAWPRPMVAFRGFPGSNVCSYLVSVPDALARCAGVDTGRARNCGFRTGIGSSWEADTESCVLRAAVFL